MRNLKKFLALVLALMMVVSVMVTVSAADLKPDGAVTPEYETAVNVLAALDILKGDDNGVYKPAEVITRAEFATMLYRLATGDVDDSDVEAYADFADFADVKADDWFAGYVGYAQSCSLLIGDGTNYHPMEKVTGYQVLVGLLRVLGYDKSCELSGNASWQINALTRAKTEQITAGVVGAPWSKDATRETVAQIFFATLINGHSLTYRSLMNDYQRSGAELGDVLFGLVKATEAQLKDREDSDEFGRPYVAADDVYYTPETGLIGETTVQQPLAVYDNSFTKKDADALKKTYTNINVKYNGGIANNDLKDVDALYADKGAAVNGYHVETYLDKTDETGKTLTVIVTEMNFACVDSFTEAKGKTPASVKLNVYGAVGGNGATMTFTDTEKDDDAYDKLAGYAKGDCLGVYVKPGWDKNLTNHEFLLAVEDLTAIHGKVDKVNGGANVCLSTITVDGTTYGLNNLCTGVVDKNHKPVAQAGDEGTLFVDSHNNALYWLKDNGDDKTDAGDKAIALTKVFTSLEDGALVTKVTGVLSNGTETTLVLDPDAADSGDTAGAKAYDGEVYTYAESETNKGTYTLKEVSANFIGTTDGAVAKLANNAAIEANAKQLNSTFFANNVKFIFVDATKKTVTVKDGVQATRANTNLFVVVSVPVKGGTAYISTVYVMAAEPEENEKTESDELVFLPANIAKDATNSSIAGKDGKAYKVYVTDLYVNGEVIEDANVMTPTAEKTAGFYKTVIDDNTGAYELGDEYKNTATGSPAVQVSSVASYNETVGVITINSIYIGVKNADVVDLTGEGFNATGNKVAVIYDAETLEASLVYVYNAAAE